MLTPAMLRGLEERFVEKNGGPRETTKTRLRSNSLPSPLALHRTKLRTQTSPSSPRSVKRASVAHDIPGPDFRGR